MGAGNGIRLASLPAVLLSTPWGRSPGNSSDRHKVTADERRLDPFSTRPERRIGDRASTVAAPRFRRDGTDPMSCRRRPGTGRARGPAGHRASQQEAPMTAEAVVGASLVPRAYSTPVAPPASTFITVASAVSCNRPGLVGRTTVAGGAAATASASPATAAPPTVAAASSLGALSGSGFAGAPR